MGELSRTCRQSDLELAAVAGSVWLPLQPLQRWAHWRTGQAQWWLEAYSATSCQMCVWTQRCLLSLPGRLGDRKGIGALRSAKQCATEEKTERKCNWHDANKCKTKKLQSVFKCFCIKLEVRNWPSHFHGPTGAVQPEQQMSDTTSAWPKSGLEQNTQTQSSLQI